MNKERIEKVIDAIERHPEMFDMSDWGLPSLLVKAMSGEASDSCGTTCCFAGWTCALFSENEVEYDDTPYTARQQLRLKDSQCVSLFYGSDWKEPFGRLYRFFANKVWHRFSENKTLCHQIAILRFRFFLATNGTDELDKLTADAQALAQSYIDAALEIGKQHGFSLVD